MALANCRRCWLILVALGALALPVQGAEDPLAKLFAELGSRPERQARFTERRFSALLKTPVESSGTLIFRAPDILERRTEKPQRELVRIEGGSVTYEGAPVRGEVQKRTFALADVPQLAALIESLRATLAGDLATLRRHYQIEMAAPAPSIASGWQLTLVPRQRAVRDAVDKIVLRGAGGEVNAVEIVDAGGDLTLLRITPVAVAPTK
jgi:hypothetical protein